MVFKDVLTPTRRPQLLLYESSQSRFNLGVEFLSRLLLGGLQGIAICSVVLAFWALVYIVLRVDASIIL